LFKHFCKTHHIEATLVQEHSERDEYDHAYTETYDCAAYADALRSLCFEAYVIRFAYVTTSNIAAAQKDVFDTLVCSAGGTCNVDSAVAAKRKQMKAQEQRANHAAKRSLAHDRTLQELRARDV